MYHRVLEFEGVLARKSVFLFGPRQTGKSTWLKTRYPDALYINLLSKKVYDDYSLNPNALTSDLNLHLRKHSEDRVVVVIDEIQKIPALLDEVHLQIENNHNLRFILTGSSARKLKRSGTNLLGGRASWRNMFPLVYPEIKDQLRGVQDIERRLLVGGIPSIFDSPAPFDDLDDYVRLYLNEEIKAEGFVRNYEAFNKFLLTSALCNAKQINFTEVGNDAQIPPRTVHDYFQILQDTLIGDLLPAFTNTPTRKAMTSAKFYLFDTGVVNALIGRTTLNAGTPEFGDLFEQYVISEVRAYISYRNQKAQLFYWRSTTKFEVDLIIQTPDKLIAVEVKGKSHIAQKDFKGLLAFAEDHPAAKKVIVTLDSRHSLDASGIEIIPILVFLEMLWNDEVIRMRF